MLDRKVRFDSLYARNVDPWGFRVSPYEREKYRATLAALPRERYAVGIEVGCSIGELTRLLSSRCDRVIGIDVSTVALSEAARRNCDLENVSFFQGEVPRAWPDISADLIVLSEVLYFLSRKEISALAECILSSCPEADCILVNFLGPTSEELQGAQAAASFMGALPNSYHLSRIRRERYCIDILTSSARSAVTL